VLHADFQYMKNKKLHKPNTIQTKAASTAWGQKSQHQHGKYKQTYHCGHPLGQRENHWHKKSILNYNPNRIRSCSWSESHTGVTLSSHAERKLVRTEQEYVCVCVCWMGVGGAHRGRVCMHHRVCSNERYQCKLPS
jgi:hypothetical protein